MALESKVFPTDQAWRAIEGGYDLQVHVAPDLIERRTDDLDLAAEFLSHGLRGFVLKSHYFPTVERAKVVSRAVPGIRAFGALTLNHSVGGLNPVAVEITARSGGRIIWMPTVDSANELIGHANAHTTKLPFWAQLHRELLAKGIAPPPLSIIDQNGALTRETIVCLEVIADYDLILATGHIGRDEIFAVVKTARGIGVRRIVITHPRFPSQNLSANEQRELADMGAFLEHCFTTTYTGKSDWDTLFADIRAVGVARCLLSTDLGQPNNPPVSEGLASFAQYLLNEGFSYEDVRQLTVTNPTALVEPHNFNRASS
jgi:hypothetical protein